MGSLAYPHVRSARPYAPFNLSLSQLPHQLIMVCIRMTIGGYAYAGKHGHWQIRPYEIGSYFDVDLVKSSYADNTIRCFSHIKKHAAERWMTHIRTLPGCICRCLQMRSQVYGGRRV